MPASYSGKETHNSKSRPTGFAIRSGADDPRPSSPVEIYAPRGARVTRCSTLGYRLFANYACLL